MSWNNAPLLNKLTATQLGGKLGAQLWGVDYKGTLYSTYQKTPGGEWSDWARNQRKGPAQVYELAAAQLEDGRSQLFVLDMKRQLWTTSQATTGGDWKDWEGPNWNRPPGPDGPKKIAAARTKGRTYLWAILDNGILVSSYLVVPSGTSAWADVAKTPEGLPWIEITACTQGDGRGVLWGIDSKLQVWGMGQLTAGGDWPKTWAGPNWLGAPKVRNIAAVEMANQKGASIWAITDDYKIIYNWQTAPGQNTWWGWSPGDFEDKLRGYEMTAAVQNNTLGRVWVISLDAMLTSQGMQLSSPVDWERFWTPPAK